MHPVPSYRLDWSLGALYNGDFWQAAAFYMTGGGSNTKKAGTAVAMYKCDVTDSVQLAAELQVDMYGRSSNLAAGYLFTLPRSGTELQGTINSDGTVSAKYTERVNEHVNVVFAGAFQPFSTSERDESHFGIVFQIGHTFKLRGATSPLTRRWKRDF